MGRFDITVCFLSRGTGSGESSVPEGFIRAVMEEREATVDHVLRNATSHCVAAALAASVYQSPMFSHQLHVVAGVTGAKETLVAYLSDTCGRSGDYGLPQQCMMFASDGVSVVCELVEGSKVSSLLEIVSRLKKIFLVALKFKDKSVTIVVVEHLSTTLIASLLCASWCHVWLLLSETQTTEQSVSLLSEAISVRDAVKGFHQTVADQTIEAEQMEALLCARATSQTEALLLLNQWRGRGTGKAAATPKDVSSEPCPEAESEERIRSLTRLLDNARNEVDGLKRKLQLAESRVQERIVAEARAADLESGLCRMRQELCEQRERAESERARVEERFQLLQRDYQSKLNECSRMLNDEKEETRKLKILEAELRRTQAELCQAKERLDEVSKENLSNVEEFQRAERNWQNEVKNEAAKLSSALEECDRLRRIISSHVSPTDAVKDAVDSARALQVRELDELLDKIRSLSSMSTSASQGSGTSCQLSHRSFRGGLPVLSPAPSA
ncbi:hypothetical protein ERJ75_000732600 [Trypanosoma vivax]|uniref:Uncharacterized protein n=1 Tax=Trypanosoma vivax (strain Y486) TaxID=1055687 RepID=G0TX85_TRYVY|nr:hypothetical protein TRVL_00619 [Trypanosoma vivax]KAH8613920.1 hypothetical protein ERJ75_000732600 [Trypanosoma vivax]CCC48575.1 conserved hypothetical protein [Trypanosoma vivax Y486]